MSLLHEYELPRDITALWQQRGAALPPLQLQEGANVAAKAMLDDIISDVVLLQTKNIAEPQMTSAVRGLIYLWNGWLDECAACAEEAPEPEQHYLNGIVARQIGDPEAARHAFAQFDDHPIYAKLAREAHVTLGTPNDAALAQFKTQLDSAGTWDPIAFIEIYEQCRACKLSVGVERMVRGFQCREIELLMVHCLQTALGDRLPRVSPISNDAETRREQRRSQQVSEAQRRKHTIAPPARTKSPTVTIPKPTLFKVKCPKCAVTLQVPTDQRGKKTTCGKCKSAFLVADGSLTQGMRLAAAAQPTIGIRCPKCQFLAQLNPAARGNAHTCAKCAAQFLVPLK